MSKMHIAALVRTAATFASIAMTLSLLSAVASLSEPQRSQWLTATASRQMATRIDNVQVVRSERARPTLVAEVTGR